jgi:hypothetical protein
MIISVGDAGEYKEEPTPEPDINIGVQYRIPLNGWIDHTVNGLIPNLARDTLIIILRRDGVIPDTPMVVEDFRWDFSSKNSSSRKSDIMKYKIIKV